MIRRAYDPEHCAACGDFLPCGDSWIKPRPCAAGTTDGRGCVLGEAHAGRHDFSGGETCWRGECRTGCYYIETCAEGENWA